MIRAAKTSQIVLAFLVVSTIILYGTLIIPTLYILQENAILRRIAQLATEIDQVKYMSAHDQHELDSLLKVFHSMKNRNNKYGLPLPAILDSLSQPIKVQNHIIPSLKVSNRTTKVPMVLGISTVQRHNQSYLQPTLASIFEHINEEEAKYVLVIVMIAESHDFEYVKRTAREISITFQKQIDQGMLEIISPPEEFYPNFTNLKLTSGDDMTRVQWRSKQSLDYAYLMMYSQTRGSSYYVQLEDDISVLNKYYIEINNLFHLNLSERRNRTSTQSRPYNYTS